MMSAIESLRCARACAMPLNATRNHFLDLIGRCCNQRSDTPKPPLMLSTYPHEGQFP
jgi:hypothetical protein